MSPIIVQGCPTGDAPFLPVAIVGAGACGLTAALMLSGAGVGCVVLERDATPCGSTALSSGFIPAGGTPMQKALAIDDDAERFAGDIQAKAHGTAAEHLVAAYSKAIVPAVTALHALHAIEFIVLDSFLYPGHSAHRMHAVPEKTGAGLMNRLMNAATNAGVDILTDATVLELWVQAGRVTGIGFARPDGRMERVRCDALILACNGFGGNATMVRELLPDMGGALFGGHAGNDGSAIAWGRLLGARLADLGGYQGHGSWAVPQGALISWALMMEGGVQINALGERFHDETQGYSEASVKVLAQPGGVAWNVFDGPLLELARTFPDFCGAEAAGAVKTCPDLAALARLIDCDASILIANFAEMAGTAGQNDIKSELLTPADGPQRNARRMVKGVSDHVSSGVSDGVSDGVSSGVGKRVFKRALTPPFYAVKVTGALFHTQGGLDIDAQCRVLHQDGTPFANLLAAGGAARGVSGNSVWGYLSGNGLLSAVAGGYIAANTAAALVQSPPLPVPHSDPLS